MRQWNSHRPAIGPQRALAFVIGVLTTAAVHADDEPAAANAKAGPRPIAVGSEVILKLPGLPIFDQDRAISVEDYLTLMVERTEAGRLLVVSRDEKIRGWAYEDETVPLEKATDYVTQVVVNDIRDADSFWVLGRLWFYQNDARKALVNLNRAIRLPSTGQRSI